MSERTSPEVNAAEMSNHLVPVTIKMVIALPAEWPKPDNGNWDYRGALAKEFYDKLIDKLMDFKPRTSAHWNEDGVSYSHHLDGEVASVEIEAGTNGDWGYAAQTIQDQDNESIIELVIRPNEGLGFFVGKRADLYKPEHLVTLEQLEEFKDAM